MFETGVKLCDEDYFYDAHSALVKPESYLYSVFNEFILHWFEHGFSKLDQLNNLPEEPQIEVKDPRTVLTLYMLSAGFYLWLITVLIACVVFIGENVVSYFASKRRSEPECEIVEIYEDEIEYDLES